MLHYWQDKFILTGYTCTTLPAHCWFAVSKSVALHWKSKKILRLSNRNSVSHCRHSALAIHYTAGWAKRVARSPDWAKYHGPDTRMTIIMQKATSWFFSICYSWWPTLVRFRTSHKPRRGSHHEALWMPLRSHKLSRSQQQPRVGWEPLPTEAHFWMISPYAVIAVRLRVGDGVRMWQQRHLERDEDPSG